MTRRFNLVALGEVLEFKSGKSIKPGGAGAFPVYGSNGVIGGVAEARERNGIVLGRVGAYCGSVTYEPGGFWASDNTIVAYPRTASSDVRFFAYLLRHLSLNRWAGGAAQPLLTQSVLKRVEAPVPSLISQRKIASILSAYDDLIENNLRRIKILEEMAQALYREWFVKFRFPGHEKVRMVASSLGEIPEGWEVGRLDDTLILQRGFDLPTKSRHPGNIPIYAATGPHGFHNEAKVKAPGVVTGRSGSLGSVMYVDQDFWPLNTTLWVKDFKKSTPLFAYYLLEEMKLDQYNSGAAVPTLNRNDVHGLPVVLPPASILGLFDELVLPAMSLCKALRRKSDNLRITRDLLLPKLISGALDVSNLDIPIPEDAA